MRGRACFRLDESLAPRPRTPDPWGVRLHTLFRSETRLRSHILRIERGPVVWHLAERRNRQRQLRSYDAHRPIYVWNAEVGGTETRRIPVQSADLRGVQAPRPGYLPDRLL
jgi:hypothetical protein